MFFRSGVVVIIFVCWLVAVVFLLVVVDFSSDILFHWMGISTRLIHLRVRNCIKWEVKHLQNVTESTESQNTMLQFDIFACQAQQLVSIFEKYDQWPTLQDKIVQLGFLLGGRCIKASKKTKLRLSRVLVGENQDSQHFLNFASLGSVVFKNRLPCSIQQSIEILRYNFEKTTDLEVVLVPGKLLEVIAGDVNPLRVLGALADHTASEVRKSSAVVLVRLEFQDLGLRMLA
ncbi:hypothetical protein HG530_014886 [Fusarium avenaceum]|nr:hypothetical protein HG530_014886 [Fusarium avenaceum]